MSYAPPSPPPYYAPPPGPVRKNSGLAIASLVLGIVALLLSWVPIINNFAAVLAVVGLGLGIPALVRARRGTHAGHGMSIAGLITSVVALVVVIATQAFYSEVIDEVSEELDRQTSSVTRDAGTEAGDAPAEEDSAADVVPWGTPAQVGDYQVTVDSVELNGNAIVAGANQFNEAPTGQYVIAQLTVTYTGTSEGNPGFDLSSVFHGSDSRQYSDSECSAVLPDDAMEAPTLNPGGSDTFQFCMDVAPAAIAGGQLSIEPLMSWDSDDRVFYAIG
ncbi:DUF4190 domain-containing protein [Blastococcus sp. TF02A-30]|uniref:DUF4190 domain-containing protein n=1 Tax=Blastococcus sp. TF02A-30 TaxID=2250580 RepID=UPI0013141599|nr:DUF4190 domain-containing protein [Blastococcus sp. TF02A-30]